ncbi:hypothetical protein VTN49DRAFT_1350 [Thermomyces lanuginosus]|uniref:uncharacterized protein n=1 Tax=Thermomyces lanuginosus TaxID=5541 RepID=UPI003742C416
MSATSTATAAMATMTSASGGHMDHGGSGSCKISMLWNWNTIDACFLSRTWHITSKGMFAGSCIGVICLVICLELFRRLCKEYDRYIIREYQRKVAQEASFNRAQAARESCCEQEGDNNNIAARNSKSLSLAPGVCAPDTSPTLRFRPTVLQQLIRALLHMVTFAIAYFVMLLAMYYNGYIIICIFIGAFLGSFIFSWESFTVSAKPTGTSGAEGATVCCG